MAVRTGAEYLAGIRDNREIWFNGARVDDVTQAPGFAATAQAVAQYYDFQSAPAHQDLLTYLTDDGDRAHLSFIQPRSKDDLRRRGLAFAAWAEVSCGSMARSPDYMNALMMAVGAARDDFGRADPELGEHAWQAYLRCRRGDLCMTHTVVSPMVDRGRPLHEQPENINAGVVERTDTGVVLQGARCVATLAPFADANFSFGMPMIGHHRESQYAIAFVHDVAAPRTRWICRDELSGASAFDAPISSRIDEMDCTLVLDRAEIPWGQVMGYRDARVHNRTFQFLRMEQSLMHHAITRFVARARFLFGIGHLLAETTQVGRFINVQERLGDMLMCLQTLESMLIAAVEGAEEDPERGIWYVHRGTVAAASRLHAELYPRMIAHLLQIGGSGYMTTPHEATLDALGSGIELYFRGANTDARGRTGLFRLAWDVAGSASAGRAQLYERFFTGDNTQVKATNYAVYDKTDAMEMVRRMLQPGTERAPFVVPERFR